MTRHSLPLLFLALVGALPILPGCEGTPASAPGDPPTPPTSPAARVTLEEVAEVTGSFRPADLGVTPDGAYVIALGYRYDVLVYTADDLEVVNELVVGAWALNIRPDGQSVLLSFKDFTSEVSIPEMAWLNTNFPLASMRLLRDRTGEFYYAVGSSMGDDGMVKIAANGEPVATIPQDPFIRHRAFELSPDERLFLAIEEASGQTYRLAVVDTDSFRLLRRIDLDRPAHVIVPLEDSRRALLLTGEWDGSRGSFVGTVVDLESGTVIGVQRVEGRNNAQPWTAEGSPWTYVPGDIAVVGSAIGLLIVDTRTGRIEQVMKEVSSREVGKYCCAVAYDPLRDRLLVAGHYHPEGVNRRSVLSAFRIVR